MAKNKKAKDRLALIDGEILCYHAVTSREFLVEQEEEGEIFQVLDFNACKDDLALRIDSILKETSSRDMILFFGGLENFRKKIDPMYKANRSPYKPMGYNKLVDWCKFNYSCHIAERIEADDNIGIMHTTPSPLETIIVSNDKDMRTVPGLLYNHTRPEDGIQNITEQQACAFWGYQTLVGDTADGYKGCPGVGPKGAQAILDKFNKSKLTGKRLQKAVFNQVCSFFLEAGLTKKDALVQARLARILHHGEYNLKTSTPKLWTP
jgi:DNA polymerase-1